MRWSTLLSVTACSLGLLGCVGKEESRSSTKPKAKSVMLLEPAELQNRLSEPGLRILDTRSKEDYDVGHVPNAVWVDVKSWQALGKRMGGFHDTEAWAAKVSQVGVSSDSRVVVYGNRLSNTARIWWLLKYVGAENVMLLNGGWGLWMKEQRPIEHDHAELGTVATSFTPRFDTDRLMERGPLKDLLGSEQVTLVDTRSRGEFTGKDARGPRGGHIPGATHLEWKELITAGGRFKTIPQLQGLFRERGILPTNTAVCY